MIELKNVSKIYKMGNNKVYALDKVNLRIMEGEFVAIFGPSGSGKSTLMHIVGCLDIPTQGGVFLEGKDISKFSESELATIRGKTIGFIFQTFNIFRTLTVLENVMLPMVFQNMPAIERKKRAKELIEYVGLGHRVDHRPAELSGGEQQRVAVARSLATDPKIVLGDEPTGNLDSKTGKKIMEGLKEMNKEGKTVILVTHDASLAHYADKIVHIKDGKIEKIEKNK
ncbi:MAG: macrolide ABC transporter ATP-binding protein [Candidatus Aenigmatarchaeota archaeon]|nr:MAG: macrolide ABC transporter ATP-binding protein [Candidatus Aenigmarchaeota archaeon]